jgi:vesicular inhibitory amino acid transporter
MQHLFGWDSFHDRQLVIVVAYAIFLTPFCMGKDFQFIEKISAAAIFSIAGMIMMVTFEYWFNYKDKTIEGYGEIRAVGDNMGDILSSFGAIAFAFSQQDQTFMIYKTLVNPTVYRFTVLSSWAMGIQFILSSFVGLFGYLSWGEAISDDVLTNYPISNHVVLVTRIIYTFTMVFIFPTAFYPVRHFFYSMVYYNQTETFEAASLFQHLLFTLGPLAFFLLLSLWITDLGFVMSLTGLLAAVLLTFIMPCACGLKLLDEPIWFWNAEDKWKSAKQTVPMWTLLIFGVLCAVIGTIQLFWSQFFGGSG